MVIKKQPVISWLLTDNLNEFFGRIKVAYSDNPLNRKYLLDALTQLGNARALKPDWGMPELVMPSFEKAMEKGEEAFSKIWNELFRDFSQQEEGGIIVSTRWNGTIVYEFGDNNLYMWFFRNIKGESILSIYCYASINGVGQMLSHAPLYFVNDSDLFSGPADYYNNVCISLSRYVVCYVALKKYAPVESIIVANKTIAKLKDGEKKYKPSAKVINECGQPVVVMDSKWFTKIINDNDIMVRGFFRMQNKKNEAGEWIKELIYVDSFVRHGYHRNAKIEENQIQAEMPAHK